MVVYLPEKALSQDLDLLANTPFCRINHVRLPYMVNITAWAILTHWFCYVFSLILGAEVAVLESDSVSFYPSKPFKSIGIEAARQWVHGFVRWYNEEHRHSAIRYVTPDQRHRGEDKVILEERKVVYEAAKEKNPQWWSGDIRNWNLVTEVWLNPPKEVRVEEWSLLKFA